MVRHGRTDWNDQAKMQGQVDIELNAEGRESAGRLGEELEGTDFDLIFTSTLIRAYETACLIRGHRNIRIIRDPRLMEISFGVAEGSNYFENWRDDNARYHSFTEDPEHYLPPEGGETFHEVYARAQSFLQDQILPLEKTCERILIVGHGCLNRALTLCMKGETVAQYWTERLQRNCAASVFILNNGTITAKEDS